MESFPDVLRARDIEELRIPNSSIMLALKSMTATVLITISMVIGSLAVGADANGQESSDSDVEQIAVANNGKLNLASNINWIERNKLKAIYYKLENGRTEKLEISNIADTKIEFDNYTEWVANFAENGLNPYSPGHSRVETTIVSDIPKNFLDSSEGTTLTYQVQEEWKNDYGMLWEIDVKIEKSEIVNFKNTNIEAVVLNLIGRSIEQNGFKESSWHHEGVTFKETQVIDKRSKVLLSRERTWENRTSKSPENEHQIQTLDKLKYRDGTVISWTELAQILRNAEEKKNNALIGKIKTKASAQQVLSDLRIFIKENPEELDSLKVAELFSPSIAEAEDGSFADKGSTFKRLVVFVGKNRQFNTYYRERSKERTASLKKKKLASLNKLKSGVKSLKNKIASDPLNPLAIKWIQMIKKYEKINIQSSLKSLRIYVVKLDKGMRESGIEPKFSVAQSINSKKKRQAELARMKAEEKKNNAITGKIKTKASAKQFLSDIRSFIKENPNVLDPLKVAELYSPSTVEAKDGKFTNKNSAFKKLFAYAGKNREFKTYYLDRSKKRLASLKKKKLAYLEKLKSGVGSLKNEIASDPLNPSAVKWIDMVKEFEKANIQSSLKSLRKHVVKLDKGMRASGVRPEFSVGQTITSSGSQKSKSGGVSSKTKRSSLNLGGVLDSDLIALAHVSNNSPNAYRDLDGKIKFEGDKIIACAPSIKDWKSQEQYYFNTQFGKKYRNAEIRFQKDCSKSLSGTDLLIVKGIDFSKSLKIPKESVLAKAFRTKELSIIVKATAKGLENERNKREILSDQYKADILGDSRLGFGALTVNKRSEIGCIVLDQDPAPHQNSITSALEARSFQYGDKTPNLLKVDTATAFRQLQRGKCGIVYGDHSALKKILEGSNKINLSTIVLPVWVSQRSIDKETERLSEASQNKQLSEAKRTSELKRRLAEEKLRKQKEAAALSNRQSEHRAKYGPKVASIVSGIELELIEVRKSLEVSIQANKNLQEAVSEHQFYSPFPHWYGKKIQGGWLFDSIISAPHDYGVGTWRDRQMEAVVSKVRVLMKNRRLGEYSDDCWFVGYLVDSEFGMHREPTMSMCKNEEVHKNWLIDQGFKTRWKFVPEG